MLNLSKESPISSLLAGTLNPIKYSPIVLIHFAYPLPLITYKTRWKLRTSVYLLEEKNHQQRNHKNVRTQIKQESPHKQQSKPRASRQGNEKDHTTEPHRIPTIEVHPTKTASKAKHHEVHKQTKGVT